MNRLLTRFFRMPSVAILAPLCWTFLAATGARAQLPNVKPVTFDFSPTTLTAGDPINLTGSVTNNSTVWRFFEFGADGQRKEFAAIDSILPGRAYWLIAQNGGRIDTGAGWSNRTDQIFKIPLRSGWNIVGNPFNFNIPVGNIRVSTGEMVVLRSYSGEWNSVAGAPVTEMRPFTGYAINVSQAPATLDIDPNLSASSRVELEANPAGSYSEVLRAYRQSAWSLRIIARSQNARDHDTFVYALAEASRGADIFDVPEPPGVGEYVSVYFAHDGWPTASKAFAIDARPNPADAGDVWPLTVETNIRDVVELSFHGIESVPPQFGVWLVDDELGALHDVRANNVYWLAGPGAFRQQSDEVRRVRLKLIIGVHDFLEQQAGEFVAVPQTYHLQQNYPNPFNPRTVIGFQLPGSSDIELAIYAITGRLVRTLVAGQLAAGSHRVLWDGRDDFGARVPSGVYVLRLQADDALAGSGQRFVQMRKMVLAR